MKATLIKWFTLLITISAYCSPAQAHPLAPALLEISHQQDNTYSVLWRLSAVQMKGITPQPVLPVHCKQSTDLSITREVGMAVASRWDVQCQSPSLSQSRIGITGLDRNPINVVLRLRTSDGTLIQALLDGNHPEFIVPDPEQSDAVFSRYLSLGMTHLAFGPDHLLFLLALIMIVGMNRKLIWTLTAFTLGHSLTLSLASLHIISANPALMELGISISLVVVARELLGKTRSILGRHPATMAASFGLLHGMGFAGALQDIGLPKTDLVYALLAFNLGIEFAQLLMVALLFFLLFGTRQKMVVTGTRHGLKILPAYLIGSLAMLWCIERTTVVLL